MVVLTLNDEVTAGELRLGGLRFRITRRRPGYAPSKFYRAGMFHSANWTCIVQSYL
jgi:hypothetical protein